MYLSLRTDRAQQQRLRRHEGAGDGAQDLLPDGLVIEVLTEIIRGNRVQIDQSAILSRLAERGIRVTALQLDQLCIRLNLKKTLAFPS